MCISCFFLLNQRFWFSVLYYALCSYPSMTLQEAGLRAFWSMNGPRILQFWYEDEEDPKVMEAYERVGSLVCQFSLVFFSLQCFPLFVCFALYLTHFILQLVHGSETSKWWSIYVWSKSNWHQTDCRCQLPEERILYL